MLSSSPSETIRYVPCGNVYWGIFRGHLYEKKKYGIVGNGVIVGTKARRDEIGVTIGLIVGIFYFMSLVSASPIADYKNSIVTGGKLDVLIIVGNDAQPTDFIAADNIATYLVKLPAGSGQSISTIVKKDIDVTENDRQKNLILVGGPAVNRLTAEMLAVSYPSYGAASGIPINTGLIRAVDNAFTSGKVVIILAGWSESYTVLSVNFLQISEKFTDKAADSATVTGSSFDDVKFTSSSNQIEEKQPEIKLDCDVETKKIENFSLNKNYLVLQQQPLYYDGYLKWDHMPILIYIDEESMRKFSYIDEEDTLYNMEKAMNNWGKETNDLIKFSRTNIKECADVYVTWLRPAQFYKSGSGGETIVYNKGYYGDFILANGSEIRMLPMGEKYSSDAIYYVFAHELGHILGLGHYEGTCDLMTGKKGCVSSEFTSRILNTIWAIYSS